MDKNIDILVKAIGEHALPRDFDWLVVGITVVSIVITFIIYFIQLKILRQQSNISNQQNVISLFSLRYEIYNDINEIKSKLLHFHLKNKKSLYISHNMANQKVLYLWMDFLSSVLGHSMIQMFNEANDSGNFDGAMQEAHREVKKFQLIFDKILFLFNANQELSKQLIWMKKEFHEIFMFIVSDGLIESLNYDELLEKIFAFTDVLYSEDLNNKMIHELRIL